jgi:hypothetical protein
MTRRNWGALAVILLGAGASWRTKPAEAAVLNSGCSICTNNCPSARDADSWCYNSCPGYDGSNALWGPPCWTRQESCLGVNGVYYPFELVCS